MAAPTTIADALEQAALQPKAVSFSVSGHTITNRDLKELQDARDRELAQQAASTTGFGLRFRKLIPPGAGT